MKVRGVRLEPAFGAPKKMVDGKRRGPGLREAGSAHHQRGGPAPGQRPPFLLKERPEGPGPQAHWPPPRVSPTYCDPAVLRSGTASRPPAPWAHTASARPPASIGGSPPAGRSTGFGWLEDSQTLLLPAPWARLQRISAARSAPWHCSSYHGAA